METIKKIYQLNRSERCQIYALKKAGLKPDDIAKQLGRHRSTIYRELSRNGCYFPLPENKTYFPNITDAAAQRRRKRELKLMQQPELKKVIVDYLVRPEISIKG